MIPTLRQWHVAGSHFDYKNNRIFYRDEGTGFPLLVIHGYPTSSWDFAPIWPQLTANRRCIAADMIGFGFSDKPPAYSYSLVDQAELLSSLLAQLDITEVDVLAHDYGDSVAQELLARHLDKSGIKLRSVIFLNGGLFPEQHRPRLVQKLLASPLGKFSGKIINYRLFAKGFSEVFGSDSKPTEAELRDFWHLTTYNNGQAIQHKLIGYMAERKRQEDRWVGALLNSDIPMRLIDGADDPVSGRHLAEHYQATVPNADVVLLENVGHYPQVESADTVWDAIDSFWQP
jgi:pimeloyl-ACP methyl ester carboxylesterase